MSQIYLYVFKSRSQIVSKLIKQLENFEIWLMRELWGMELKNIFQSKIKYPTRLKKYAENSIYHYLET